MALQIAAPERQKRAGGLREIIGEFTPEQRLAAVPDGVAIGWEDSGCGLPKPTRAGCYDEVVAAEPKGGDGVDQLELIDRPFAAYAGVECWIGGDNDGASYLEQARALLTQGEERPVEGKLWAWATAGTPDAAASILAAIAELDDAADKDYVGKPLIVMSRYDSVLALAADAVVERDGRLYTPSGNPVLATGSVPDDERGTVAAVGWPRVYATEITAALGLEHSENLALAIAERVYGIGVDCEYRHSVTVTP